MPDSLDMPVFCCCLFVPFFTRETTTVISSFLPCTTTHVWKGFTLKGKNLLYFPIRLKTFIEVRKLDRL